MPFKLITLFRDPVPVMTAIMPYSNQLFAHAALQATSTMAMAVQIIGTFLYAGSVKALSVNEHKNRTI
jgi:hypothetical protein